MNEIRIIPWDGHFTFGYRVILVGNGSPLYSELEGDEYEAYLYRQFTAGHHLIINEMDRFARLVQDDSGQPLSLLYLNPRGHNHAEIIKGIIQTVLNQGE